MIIGDAEYNKFIADVRRMRWDDGMAWENVAEACGMPLSTMKDRMRRGGYNCSDFPTRTIGARQTMITAYPAPRQTVARPTRKRETLCWKCANAVPCKRDGTGCSWSKRFIPVEGWTAEQAWLGLCNKDGRVTDTYTVHACPQFVKG